MVAQEKHFGRAADNCFDSQPTLSVGVKKLEKDDVGNYTVVLSDTGLLSAARCSMDTVHATGAAGLRAGSSVTMRCICTGFNKDEMGLGSDVILNRCAAIKNKD